MYGCEWTGTGCLSISDEALNCWTITDMTECRAMPSCQVTLGVYCTLATQSTITDRLIAACAAAMHDLAP